MENQTAVLNTASISNETGNTHFEVGTEYVYGLNGRCILASIEPRIIEGKTSTFYKLHKIKNTFSRSTKTDLAIWIPASRAVEMGLRKPLATSALDSILTILTSKEFYFNPNDHWGTLQIGMEAGVRKEGPIGLAKAYSFLYVLTKRQVVPTPEVSKLNETVSRLFVRELADALQITTKEAEEKAHKMMRPKLLADN